MQSLTRDYSVQELFGKGEYEWIQEMQGLCLLKRYEVVRSASALSGSQVDYHGISGVGSPTDQSETR